MQSAFLQPSLFNTSLNPAPDTLRKDLCVAYFAACKGKKKKQCVREFDQHWEDNLRQLHHELLTGTYQIRPSTCFIIRDPVQREVFAADFRDRIVHHLLYNYLAPIYEKQFIYDSYSCRVGKGTHFGIQRMKRFMRASSENFTKEAWVLKLDVKGFFMNIDKRVLRGMIENFLQWWRVDHDFLLHLIHQIIFHDPTEDAIIKGKKADRRGLPADKSLFCSWKDKGLAIGNLTSQLFANIYLDRLDTYLKYELGFHWYGRYVDDFVLFHQDKQQLLQAIPLIRSFLSDQLHLALHPKKIYLQPLLNGVLFLWTMIKPYRSYLRKRTIGKWYQKIQTLNQDFDQEKTLSVMNSYLGMAQHHSSYHLSRQMRKFCNNHIRSRFYFNAKGYKLLPLIRKLTARECKNLFPQGWYKGSAW